MKILTYMKDVFNGRMVGIGEEIGTIDGPGIYTFPLPSLPEKDQQTSVCIVGRCDMTKTYPFICDNKGFSGGIRACLDRQNWIIVKVEKHPENGYPPFPLKVVVESTIGHSISGFQHLSTKIQDIENKLTQNQSVFLVVQKNTLNCASTNLSAHMSKDDAYKQALSLTRTAKDNKFLYEVEEVAVSK